MYPNISKFISVLAISLLFPLLALAQDVKGISEGPGKTEAPLFGGVAVSADLVGPMMEVMDNEFTQMEVAARINFKNKYFPIFEMGYGESEYEGAETGNTYHTQAPYFRIGMDYNFTKKWNSGNRIFLGVRYAFTSFRYDVSAPTFHDPVWDMDVPFIYTDLKGRSQWGEIVGGVETRIWKFFRIGWNVRYKIRIAQKGESGMGPWYIPGYGKTGTSALGGAFNLVFDLNRKK